MKTISFTKPVAFCRPALILLMQVTSSFVVAQSGTSDASFNKPDKIAGQGANNTIEVSALQEDGKLIIAGEFMYYNGAGRTRLARLKPDGSLDESFNARGGTQSKINAITVLPNNKILVAGNFKA